MWVLLCICQLRVHVLQGCWMKGKIADLGRGPAHLTTLTSLPPPSSALPIVLRLSTVGSHPFSATPLLPWLPPNDAHHHSSICCLPTSSSTAVEAHLGAEKPFPCNVYRTRPGGTMRLWPISLWSAPCVDVALSIATVPLNCPDMFVGQ